MSFLNKRWRWEWSGLVAGMFFCAAGTAQCIATDSWSHVVSVQRDALLGSTWGMAVRCDHPEWPARMTTLPMGSHGLARVAAPVLRVLVGESVRLWQDNGVARIETVGTAEESGVEGQRVKVRLFSRQSEGGAAKRSVIGLVRGAGNVEIER